MIQIRPVSDLRNKFPEIEKAILERQPIAESFEIYHSLRERNYPYYPHLRKEFYYLLCCNR